MLATVADLPVRVLTAEEGIADDAARAIDFYQKAFDHRRGGLKIS